MGLFSCRLCDHRRQALGNVVDVSALGEAGRIPILFCGVAGEAPVVRNEHFLRQASTVHHGVSVSGQGQGVSLVCRWQCGGPRLGTQRHATCSVLRGSIVIVMLRISELGVFLNFSKC